jgi:hypothetical protein
MCTLILDMSLQRSLSVRVSKVVRRPDLAAIIHARASGFL